MLLFFPGLRESDAGAVSCKCLTVSSMSVTTKLKIQVSSNGDTPKSSTFIEFSIINFINHLFWGTPNCRKPYD